MSLSSSTRSRNDIQRSVIRGHKFYIPNRVENLALVMEIGMNERVAEIEANRIVLRTRKGYESKLKVFRSFVQENAPQLVTEDNQIDYGALPVDLFKQFIARKQSERHSFSSLNV